MVEPCDKYQSLVVGPDGQTVSDPYGFLPTLADYEEWRQVADSLITRAEQQVTRYFEENGAVPNHLASPTEAVRLRWDDMGGVVQQSFTDPKFSWAADIAKMVEIARDAACQVGVVEAARVELGGMDGTVPAVPKGMPPSSGTKGSGKGGKGMGLILILLLGAWAVSRD